MMSDNEVFNITTVNGTNGTTGPTGFTNMYVGMRLSTLPVAFAGLLLCGLSLTALVHKYRCSPEVFDVGLILMQGTQVSFCLSLIGYIPFDVTLILLERTRGHSSTNVAFSLYYYWLTFCLILKNSWAACMSVFRCLATFQPIKFRTWLTRRFQLLSFAALMLVAATATIGGFAVTRRSATATKQYMISMLQLIRSLQSYIPLPLILLASCCTAAHLYKTMGNRPVKNPAASAAASEASEAAVRAASDRAVDAAEADPDATVAIEVAVARANTDSNDRGNAGAAVASSRIWRNATRIMLLLAASFAVFELPGAIFITFGLYKRFPDWMVPVNDVLVSMESVMSFIIFYNFSDNFRAQVRQALSRRQAPPNVGVRGGSCGSAGGETQQEIHPLVDARQKVPG